MPEGMQQGPDVQPDTGVGSVGWVAEKLQSLKGGARTVTVGRIVHYTNLGDADGKYPPETQPALIVRVNDDGTVGMWAFYPSGLFYMQSVKQADEDAPLPQRGRWNWPPLS